MEKTKLGLSAKLVAALCFLFALFGGYVIAGVAAGYILICEENKWLKRMALKAILVLVTFSLLSLAINLLPDVMDMFIDMIRIFKSTFLYEVTGAVSRVVTWLSDILYLLKLAVYALLVIFAAFGKTVRLPLIDKICDKCISDN